MADTGEGMTTEVLAKAFEPFFTTKEVGKGTGLGLSQVYGLARQSGGIARIRSKPGAGTEVEIYLPRAPAAASSALLSEGDGAEGSVRRRGTVLIVDDQEDVREFAAVHLETLGYQTIHAANGRTALDLLEAGGRRGGRTPRRLCHARHVRRRCDPRDPASASGPAGRAHDRVC